MKKKDYLAFVCLFCLLGCSKPDINLMPEKKFPVRFSLRLNTEVLPFTRALPPDPPTDPDEVCELNELCNAIEYVVFKEEDTTTPIQSQKYTSDDDDDFGIVYDSLPPGNYKVVFIAYTSCVATLSGHVMTFDKLSDTFHTAFTLEIQPEGDPSKDVSLNRIVGKIEFVATDAVPAKVACLTTQITPYSKQLDVITGKSTVPLGSTESYTTKYDFLYGDKGKTNLSFSFLTFIPSTNKKFNIETQAIAANHEIIHQRNINNITPLANRTIRYTGLLYTPAASDDTFTIEIEDNGKWGDTIENTF
ncbi:hypothetical protein Barb7_00401 [Bacteroidales bacterium Barb7]|nr:hypothetical protein Barb7_00401 [Bacteroidales bacterium Barb7]